MAPILTTAPGIGNVVTGKVVQSAPFGVFIDIGLPHHAFIDLANMDSPEITGFPKIGQMVTAVVVDLTDDGYARLSTRRADIEKAAN